MTAPRVYAAIAAVTAELATKGIAKSQVNRSEQYAYRGIDDVLNALAPLLAKHRLCILPRVVMRWSTERCIDNDALAVSVVLKVAFDITSARDGSQHSLEVYGEAIDSGDKATAKAMSAAYKQAVLHAFCIPIGPQNDADASTFQLKQRSDPADPDQGWAQWALDIQEMIRICETEEALDRVTDTYRAVLRAASKREPGIYSEIGNAFQVRRQALAALHTRGSARPSVSCRAGALVNG